MAKEVDQKVKATGGVLDPHLITQAFADALPDGDIAVKVLSVLDENPEHASKYSTNWMIECEYPDGYITWHQVAKTGGEENFLTAIRNKLRARHGTPHNESAQEGTHGLNHVAGDLVVALPEYLPALVGTSITFKKVG